MCHLKIPPSDHSAIMHRNIYMYVYKVIIKLTVLDSLNAIDEKPGS